MHFGRCIGLLIFGTIRAIFSNSVSANLVMSPVHAQSPEWTKVRDGVLLRDNHRCVECGVQCGRADADVHHLLPRSAGGTDEPSNLVTLCDGCHAAHHPKLAGRLARRVMERWAVRLALWLDRHGVISEASRNFGAVLRLFGLERFRDGQLPVVEAALMRAIGARCQPYGLRQNTVFSAARSLATRCERRCLPSEGSDG